MTGLRRISFAELRLLVRAAKVRHSGTILVETPLAQASLSAAPALTGELFPAPLTTPVPPPAEVAWHWHHGVGADTLPAFFDALAAIPVPPAGPLARDYREWMAANPEPRFRDGSTTRMLERAVEVLEAASDHGILVVEVSESAALDRHLLHLARSILDRMDRVRVILLVRYNAPDAFASPEDAACWGHAVAGLLDLCVKSRMWNRASLVLDELMRHLHALPDEALRGHVLFRAGMAAVRQGRTRDAESFYGRSIEALEVAGDHETLVKALNNIGNLRLGEGRYDSAETSFARALKLGEELQSDYHLAVTYGNYARLWLERARPDQAEAQVRKSFLFMARSGYYHHAHFTFLTLGEILSQAGETAEAEVMMRRAASICETQENLVDLGFILVGLGRFLVTRQRLDEAATVLERAGDLYARLGGDYGKCTLHEAMGELCLARGDRAGARRHAADAERLADRLQNAGLTLRIRALGIAIESGSAADAGGETVRD